MIVIVSPMDRLILECALDPRIDAIIKRQWAVWLTFATPCRGFCRPWGRA